MGYKWNQCSIRVTFRVVALLCIVTLPYRRKWSAISFTRVKIWHIFTVHRVTYLLKGWLRANRQARWGCQPADPKASLCGDWAQGKIIGFSSQKSIEIIYKNLSHPNLGINRFVCDPSHAPIIPSSVAIPQWLITSKRTYISTWTCYHIYQANKLCRDMFMESSLLGVMAISWKSKTLI